MTRKIKKVEIDSFRAYRDKEIFDMTTNGEVANLVVVYAPNGSGKTSFFDAVEWTLSGEIKRISDNNRVKEIADIEKGHILKNKYNDKTVGMVDILFSDNEEIKVSTKEIKGNRKTDYTEGDELYITSKIKKIRKNKKNNIIQKNILTHDQVDKFLRFQNSKERYDALKIFWDVNGDTEIFKNLIVILHGVEIQRDEIEKKRKAVLTDLEKLKMDSRLLKKLNEKIILMNTSFFREKENMISLLTNNNSKEVFDECIKRKVQKEKYLSDTNYNQNNIEFLIMNYMDGYQNKKEYIKKINEIQLKKEYENQNKLKMYTKKETEQKKYLNEKNNIQERMQSLLLIIENYDLLLELDRQKNDLENEKYQLLNDRERIGNQLLKVEENLFDAKNILNETRRELVGNSTEIDKVNELLRVVGSEKKKSKISKELHELLKAIDRNEKDINGIEFINKKYLEILDMELMLLIKNKSISTYLSKECSEAFEQLLIVSEEINAVNIEVKRNENKLKLLKKIGDDISRMKKIGIDILSNKKESTCPLCNSSYTSLDTLLKQISKNNQELYEINDLSNEIEKLKKQAASLKDFLKECYDRFIVSLNIEMETHDKEINKLQEKTSSQQALYKSKLSEIIKYEEDERLETELLKYFHLTNIEGFNNQEIHKLNTLYKDKKETLLENEKKVLKVVLDLEIKMEEITHKNKQNEVLLNQIEVMIQKVLNNSIYKNCMDNKMVINDLNLAEIKPLYKNLNKEYKKIQYEIEALDSEIVIIKEDINNLNYDEVNRNIKKIEMEIEIIQQEINSYSDKFIRYFGHNNIQEVHLRNENNSLVKRSKELNEEIDVLLEISNTLSSYLTSDIKINKEKEIEDLNIDYEYVSKKIEELKIIKNVSHEYIKDRIEKVFNLKSVNKIFQMIDPHPKMTDIVFKLDETVKDSLGLNIMCKGRSQQSQPEAPILYLSSAQVNILSLSIFLASAIESTNEFSTILMDDPIQHLDGLNVLSFIDLLRIICFTLDKQIVISTHDERFFNLLQKKIDSRYFSAKYLRLTSNGRIVDRV
ncbi:AAA family ATPase [Bacillus cereus]|nr:AAA family ATPase [Bacillus cereus]MDA2053232.1 AAA family ATPase [Bacillus cereus]